MTTRDTRFDPSKRTVVIKKIESDFAMRYTIIDIANKRVRYVIIDTCQKQKFFLEKRSLHFL